MLVKSSAMIGYVQKIGNDSRLVVESSIMTHLVVKRTTMTHLGVKRTTMTHLMVERITMTCTLR